MRLLVFWIALILIAGCNSSQQDSAKHTVKTHIVEIKQMKFVPEQLELEAGDSIRWINRDIVIHNVADETSDAWVSPNLKTGESFTKEINAPGSYKCTLHPVMKGTILLTGGAQSTPPSPEQ